MQEQRDLLRERRKFLRGYSVFRFFWCQADFEEDAQFFSCVEFTASAIEALRKRQIIHRIDSMKQSGCAGGFVALQMPDQMPAAYAMRMASAGCVFDTAIRVISSARRPAFCAAAAMRSCTLKKLSRME